METVPLHLTDEIAAEVNGAYEAGRPVMIAYVDAEGWPHLSYRGSTHVFGPQQLAVWARNPDGGLPNAVGDRPRVTLFVRNPETRQTYVFYGHAQLATDEATKKQVYEGSPQREQELDPDRLGVAVVIDLERVEGMSPDGRFRMERG